MSHRFRDASKTLPLLLCLVVALMAASPPPAQAQAAPRPRVEGRTCDFPEQRGVWVGYFNGYYEETSVFTLRDVRRNVQVWRCFESEQQCKAWLYWMRSDFDRGPQIARCQAK